MLKRKKKDPRLADLKSATSNKSPDMAQPTSVPEPEKRTSRAARTGRTTRTGRSAPPSGERPAPNRPAPKSAKKGWFANRPAWLPTFLAVLGIGLLAYLLASGMSRIASTLHANQERETISNVWRQLLIANVKVDGTPTALNESGEPSFPSVSMEMVTDKLSLHRNLRLAAALPGVQSLNLSPEFKRVIGGGIADDTSLALAAKNFPVLDSLDLSATKITSLTAITDMQVSELRLINATIKYEKLPQLGLLNSVTEVWIGWDFDSRAENAVYTSPEYKQQVLVSLAKMKNLKNLFLYELKYDAEERKKLPGVNIETYIKN